MLTPTISRPRGPSSRRIRSMNGKEAMHDTHHEAQKSTYTTLPDSCFKLLSRPPMWSGQSGAERDGAVAATGAVNKKAQQTVAAARPNILNPRPQCTVVVEPKRSPLTAESPINERAGTTKS